MTLALIAALLVLYLGDQKVYNYFNDVQPSHVIVGIVIGIIISYIGIRRGWR